jgi:hypothetical protein
MRYSIKPLEIDADDAFGFLCRSPSGPEVEKSETELPDSTE